MHQVISKKEVSLPVIVLLVTVGIVMSGCQRGDHHLSHPLSSVTKVRKLEDWRFQADILDIGEKEGWYDTLAGYFQWKKVTVPGAWDTYDEALWGYEGVGWYATLIPAGTVLPHKIHILRFGRVNYSAKVWLNGVLVGEHTGGFLPFEWDVTRYLRQDKDNLLVVKADNRVKEEWLPGNRQIEWVQYGGLVAPVYLEAHDPVYINDLQVYAVPRQGGALVRGKVSVVNKRDQKAKVRITLTVPEVKMSGTVTLEGVCNPHETTSLTFSLSLEKADLWSPALPRLYTLQARLSSLDQEKQIKTVRFGIREIHIAGRQILLNGRPLYLKGFNRYDIFGREGPLWDRERIREDLLKIKATGANIVRVHYPQSPLTLDLLDETGLLLIEELPLNWWGQNWWGGETVRQDTAILQQARRTLREMIRRDRHHPCILAWSVANECRTETEEGTYVVSALIREAHRLDTTRPVTFTVNNETDLHPAYRLADLVSCNVYYGNDKAFHISQLDSLVRQPAEEYLRRQLAVYPGKPLLVTEFGAGGIYGLTGDAPFTEEYQAAYIAKMWEAIGDVPQCSGGILWCWRDYYHRKYFTQTYAPFGPYGVLNTKGEPKRSYDTLQKIFGGK